MIFVFLLLQRYKPKYNSRNNNWLNRHTITFVMNTQKLEKCDFFEVTSQIITKDTVTTNIIIS